MLMSMTFEEICTFEVLYRAYLAARKGKRRKLSAAQYEANVLMLTERLAYILNTDTYVPSKFETFFVYEPQKTAGPGSGVRGQGGSTRHRR